MSSKYDKTIAIAHDEEGTYHRREYEYSPRRSNTTTTEPVITYESYEVAPPTKYYNSKSVSKVYDSDSDKSGDKYDEWTTSKRKINHKTRQVETRVSRQLLVEDGKVIADSGPQITTRIKEDNKVEECEKEKAPKNKDKFDAINCAPESGAHASSSGRVLGEKKEIQRVSREIREENMQYHDERFKELKGKDVHRRAIQAPHELITITDEHNRREDTDIPRGKMVHYSNKGKKYQDTNEILEVAKLAIDGSITKEVKRTKHHEEYSEDEQPDEKGEAEQLRIKPVVERSSRRHVDYVNDFDDSDSHSAADDHQRRSAHKSTSHRSQKQTHDDEAFPRYEIDPLLNSLRDEDFAKSSSPSNHTNNHQSRRHFEYSQRRNMSSDDDDDDKHVRRHQYASSRSPARSPAPSGGGHVEIPEEYRANRQRLLSAKQGGGGGGSSRASSVRNHHISPARQQTLHSPTNKQHNSIGHQHHRQAVVGHKEDASTQAHLTDEEVERRSMSSTSTGGGGGNQMNSHEKTTKYLQRQSTPNSSRHYYYGDSKHKQQQQHKTSGKTAAHRRQRVSSSSSSSSSDIDDATFVRRHGATSRDSGFRSPAHSQRTDTPASADNNKIYSVSGKSKHHRAPPVSPTPTNASLGQRSVKTTTTTMSAGLADRPLAERQHNSSSSRARKSSSGSPTRTKHFINNTNENDDDNVSKHYDHSERYKRSTTSDHKHKIAGEKFASTSTTHVVNSDTISVSSLKGPNATKIKVPYRRVIESTNEEGGGNKKQVVEKSSSEMSFEQDIVSLSKRLASIQQHEERTDQEHQKRRFDYKTIVADMSCPPPSGQQVVVRTYNVNHIEHDSPFYTKLHSTAQNNNNNNNNEPDFNINQFVKYHALPALVDQSVQLTCPAPEDDRLSQVSADSLQSCKTYKICTLAQNDIGDQKEQEINGEKNVESEQQDDHEEVDFDKLTANKTHAAAWIFDPRDNSSTAIVPPARPKQPEAPKVDAKTEELAQARGGRSYYLELIESTPQSNKLTHSDDSRQSLYSATRWTSQGALNTTTTTTGNNSQQQRHNNYKTAHKQQQQRVPLAQLVASRSSQQNLTSTDEQLRRRQLPFSGAPSMLGDRSKSSSCLLNVTRPSKYSIYGGFKKPNENNKPVPRLSYSRAIGPRSQRALDNQPKTPSRYLKMR